MEYTQGEWKLENIIYTPIYKAQDIFSDGNNGKHIARVFFNDINPDSSFPQENNAQLIAAAPIGYELAEAVLNNAGSIKIKEIASRFLAKAEGK